MLSYCPNDNCDIGYCEEVIMAVKAKVLRNYRVTLPASVRKKVRLRVGDLVRIEATDDGILLCPIGSADRSQDWFRSRRWQEEERKVERDIRRNRLRVSKNIEAFLIDLER